MRVHELAKKLGMENRDLIPELKRLGIAASSHSSALDDVAVQKVLQKLTPKAKPAPKAGTKRDEVESEAKLQPAKPEALKREVVTKESAPRKRATPPREPAKGPTQKSPPVVIEEPPKVDKRRILFKRKKGDDEVAAELAAGTGPAVDTLGALGAPFQVGGLAPALPGGPAAVGAAPLPEAPASGALPAQPRADRAGAAREASPAVASAPLVGAAQAAPAPAAETDERRLDKKKGVLEPPLGETAELRDKAKRPKRPGRTRDEEEVKFREDMARWQDLRAIPVHRRDERSRHVQPSAVAEITKPRKKVIKLSSGLTVKEFAELVGQRPADTVKKLLEMGQMLTLNQAMNLDVALLIADGLGLKAEVLSEKQGEELLEEAAEWTEAERLESRPPVVTIMGHVDHGKTSLLDAIRQTKVTEQEAGGITQHIGAYTVRVHDKRITFLDTPGHEAFTAMRARGAKITDIVVLVVAADDGVMPQTVEAIDHAAAANVPVIVAINKIDKAGANPDRVKHALAERNLIPEAWGGQTIVVEVSAKQKVGLESLLEMILLQSEVLELKTDSRRPAKGAVVEAKLDRGRGPVATVLVQSGTLRVGDAFVVGTFSGRVRGLLTDTGQKVSEATPSMPVEVVGLPGVPAAGDLFVVVKDESVAREIAEDRLGKQRSAELAAGSARVTLEDLYARIKEGAVKELAVLIKSDVQGSAEALSEAVEKLSTAAVKLRVIHSGVGGITETDVLLASASQAIIIGFNIRPEPKATALAEHEGVDVRLYTIIYDAIADIKAAMEGLLEPTLKERVLGRAEVRQVFTIAKVGTIAGCYVIDGTISRASAGVRVVRDQVTVYQGKLSSLRRFKDDVRDVQQGYECGIGVENFSDLKMGDVLEVYAFDKVAAKL
ncbi:MAG: translation initiation factor IF-2 [Nitrospirae bacterium 13_1_40CM_4_62_6]|nr:MAG: translation initiation factor IF-2 [Nitrospirae bacterium 13_1_40CM_4_62_6]OLC82028.1 MAG: translation initiation factor IF-2 [Nitrospirae bacterium 13_1_40CM_3_62_11]OLD39449.1 MAG: translation initiation factor IF-2 [Nitrospirae bacterium 13_1_40CM_2_62_10]